MDYTELLYCLMLKNTAGIGNILAKRLFTHFKSAQNVFDFNENELLKITGISINHISNLKKSLKNIATYEKEVNFIIKNNIVIYTLLDENYSKLLLEVPDAPLFYFSEGNFNLNNKINISIVGTRNITDYGKKIINDIIDLVSNYNVNIISGLAYGVDIETHKQCIAKNVSTIAILAHGLSQVYPSSHKKYIHSILKNGGIITEFTSDISPEREYFLQRNRIIAALSPLTIVVESAYGGGALNTANYAFNYNREVLAIPGKATDTFSQGCNNLIKQNKAQIFTRPEDIIDILNLDNKIIKSIQPQLNIYLNDNEEEIISILKKNNRVQIDALSIQINKPTYQLMNTLLELEFKGIIKPLSGKFYELV